MFEVRPLRSGDAPAAARLIVHLTRNINDPASLASRIAGLVREQQALWLVAESSDKAIIGLAGMPWYQTFNGPMGQIEEVVVCPSARRKGVASQMLKNLLAGAKKHGVHELKLTTVSEYAGLYGEFGFVAKNAPLLVRKYLPVVCEGQEVGTKPLSPEIDSYERLMTYTIPSKGCVAFIELSLVGRHAFPVNELRFAERAGVWQVKVCPDNIAQENCYRDLGFSERQDKNECVMVWRK